METRNGFSLLELLTTVAISLIVIAMCIPSLIRSEMAANEASAVASVRAINTAAATYNETYGNGFPASLLQIGGGAGAGTASPTCDNALLIDGSLGESNPSEKSGYSFKIEAGLVLASDVPPAGCSASGYSDGYGIVAAPQTLGMTGQNQFCSDATGVIRYDPTGVGAMYGPPDCSVDFSPLLEGGSRAVRTKHDDI